MVLYTCIHCNYSTNLKANFNRHNNTKKHRNKLEDLEKEAKEEGVNDQNDQKKTTDDHKMTKNDQNDQKMTKKNQKTFRVIFVINYFLLMHINVDTSFTSAKKTLPQKI